MNAVLVPPQPKTYHIVHVDRLPTIVADGLLCCDAEERLRSHGWPSPDVASTR